MIVLSQDEKHMVNMNLVEFVTIFENNIKFKNYVIQVSTSDDYQTIGTYTEEERAKQVFHELLRVWSGGGASLYKMPKG